MNYLCHLYLSGDDPDILTGNFMGDFVKGRLDDRYPSRLRTGIELHRGIDSFAHTHPAFNRSRHRIDASFGLYRGILVDLFYDHFLAATWSRWHEHTLARYLHDARAVVEARRPQLPDRLQRLVPVIFEEMIPSYLEVSGVGESLARMSRRVTRVNPLARGEAALVASYQELQTDFEEFLPAVRGFAAAFIEQRG